MIMSFPTHQAVRVALTLLCTSLQLGLLAQQDSLALRYATLITKEDMVRDLTILSSDAYEGRDTGKPGQKMAAAYLRDHFIAQGIPPVPAPDPNAIVEGYYQPFELMAERSGSISITAPGQELSFLRDLLYFNESLSGDRTVKEVHVQGDGSKLEKAKDLQGGVVLIADKGQEDLMLFMAGLRSKAEAAAQAGAEILLVATPRMQELVDQMGHFVGGERMRLAGDAPRNRGRSGPQVILVDEIAMGRLLGRTDLQKGLRRKPGKRVPVDFVLRHRPQIERVVTENVLAYIEGSDKKDELIVLTAHYDHIGIEDGEVYNGADDDGSGTVAIMAIAKAFAAAKAAGHGPRRSILVMPVSAEEKGLLGSQYYSDNPVFPLENTVANLNIDMIGRVDSVHTGSVPYVYVIGSDRLSSGLHAVNEEANTNYAGLELDYTFNALDDPNRFYYRSDHYNFAKKGVPAIFYFSGVHEDYHQPGDTVDKIMFDLLHQRALLVFHTAWLLANREERIVVDKK